MDPVNAMLGTTEVTHKGKLDSLSIPENLQFDCRSPRNCLRGLILFHFDRFKVS